MANQHEPKSRTNKTNSTKDDDETKPLDIATTAHTRPRPLARATQDDSASRSGGGRGQGRPCSSSAVATAQGNDPDKSHNCHHHHHHHHHHHNHSNNSSIHNDEQEDVAERSSDFSSISEDSLPPIRAFGHSYHGSGRIMLPNDESGSRHMALFHELYKLCLGGRLTDSKLRIERDYVDKTTARGDVAAHRRSLVGQASSSPSSSSSPSPLMPTTHDDEQQPQPFQILDIGSGNGLWAVEMARAFPDAEILGVDLTSSLLPKDVPSNLTFEVTDVMEQPWSPRLYDLIHMRNPVGGGMTDWPSLIAEAWAHLKPGGQIELSSMRPKFYDGGDMSSSGTGMRGGGGGGGGVGGGGGGGTSEMPAAGETPEIGSACREFEIAFGAMCEAQGIDFDPLSRIGVTLTRLGAESVRERGDWLPVRNWGGDPITRRKGELAEQIIDVGLDQWALMLFSRCGWKEEDTRDLLRRVKEEIGDPKMRSMFRLVFVTARKPLPPAAASH